MYHKWQSYDTWFLRYEAWRTEFFVILGCFLPFYLPNNPKNQHFEKLEKNPGDIIIFHMCNIHDNQMIYGSWDIEHDGQNFLSFWTIFWHYWTYPLKTQKIKLLKKWKKLLEIFSFYVNVPKIRIICYTVPEMWHVTDVITFHFGLFFALFCPHNSQKKIWKFQKKWKKHLEILSFYTSVPKIMIICYVPEKWCVTDVIIFHFGPFFALLPI